MGIIKAAINAVGGGLADSWLEVIEPSPWATTPSSVPVSLFRRTAKVRTKRVLKTSYQTEFCNSVLR